MAVSKSYTPPSKNGYAKRMKSIRAAELRLVEFRLSRPVATLDAKAKELGIYDADFHILNRRERKHLVSKALSKQLKAA